MSSEPNEAPSERGPPATPRWLRLAKIAALLVVAIALGLGYRFGVFAQLAEPRQLAQTLVAMGAWGYLAFVLSYTVLQPFGVPGTVFIVAAPLIWPWPTAFALSMVGTMSASVVGFSFARFVARDWIAARIPARFRKYDDALENDAFRTVVVLRLIFWMPQLLHSFLGVSKVPFWTHFWGSLVGYLAPLFVVSYLGAEIFDASGRMQARAWPILGALLALSLLLVAIMRRYGKRERGPQAR
ncbi:MAG TPA: VTT domain-containing protein [Polyangiales bacterium]|nr:VTT domain-containing protein [Polyangiales bacterium]